MIDHIFAYNNMLYQPCIANISFNKLKTLQGITCCPYLLKLDVSYNYLKNVDQIIELKKLEILYIHFNNIVDIEHVEQLNHLT